jgi:hypothetical protein
MRRKKARKKINKVVCVFFLKAAPKMDKPEWGMEEPDLLFIRPPKPTIKVLKSVHHRSNLKKFGKCAHAPPGPEPGVTTISTENIVMHLYCHSKAEDEQKAVEVKTSALDTICASSFKYVPPSMRPCEMQKPIVFVTKLREIVEEDEHNVKISNLDEETTLEDFRKLVNTFGRSKSTRLPKDGATGLCRGFGFVVYERKDQADAAVQRLNGYGYAHQRLEA